MRWGWHCTSRRRASENALEYIDTIYKPKSIPASDPERVGIYVYAENIHIFGFITTRIWFITHMICFILPIISSVTPIGPLLAHLLAPYCDQIGALLDPYWTPCWPPVGPKLEPYWPSNGPLLDFYWTSICPLLALIGPLLAP